MNLKELKTSIIFNYGRLNNLCNYFLSSIEPNKKSIKYYKSIKCEVQNIITELEKVHNIVINDIDKKLILEEDLNFEPEENIIYLQDQHMILNEYRKIYDNAYFKFNETIKKVYST